MPSPELTEKLLQQYLQTPTGRVKLASAMIGPAEQEIAALRGTGGRDPCIEIIDRIRDTSRRLAHTSPTGSIPPMLKRVIDELESAWHDYQNLPRPGRYRTLTSGD